MQFSGYWVSNKNTFITLEHSIFDEIDLTPESNWKEAWQNIDSDAGVWGYVEIKAAIKQAAKLVAKINHSDLTEIEIETLLNETNENLAISPLSSKLISISTGYKLSTIDDVKALNAAVNY